MIALLIHYVGFLLINSAVPPHIESADAYFLAGWYAGFAAVDLIAICFAKSQLRLVLGVSFAWSCSLVIECATLQDTLQHNDWLAQIVIDTALLVVFCMRLINMKMAKRIVE